LVVFIVGNRNIERDECFIVREFCILDLQLGVKINSAAGCTGRGNREEEREGYATKCAYRTVCFHIIYQETQFCGINPRERVNHTNLFVLCG
jgi:hypothetical protein